MGIKDEIEALKSRALHRIGEAARTGDTRIIVGATRIVQEAERLIKVFDELVSEKGRLAMELEGLGQSRGVDIYVSPNNKISPRMKGRRIKEAFINDLKRNGIALKLIKDSIIETERREHVGVAYSSEHTPGRWWLGIKNDRYKAIVLICERDNGELVRFILDRDFWDKNVKKLKENRQGRSMIHIIYQRGVYYFDVSGERISINNFINAYKNIQ